MKFFDLQFNNCVASSGGAILISIDNNQETNKIKLKNILF